MENIPLNLTTPPTLALPFRESVIIALTYDALNHLDLCDCDIQNEYLQSPSSEKHFIICGPEFGLENIGSRSLIIRALYERDCAGPEYWRQLALPCKKWVSIPGLLILMYVFALQPKQMALTITNTFFFMLMTYLQSWITQNILFAWNSAIALSSNLLQLVLLHSTFVTKFL